MHLISVDRVTGNSPSRYVLPVGYLTIYFFNFHHFGGSGSGGGGGVGGGGGSGVGGGRGISWDAPLLTDCSIFLFIEKA